ncbi:MAG: DUF1207 domain-containing protein [Planctomycetaceae bacterium]
MIAVLSTFCLRLRFGACLFAAAIFAAIFAVPSASPAMDGEPAVGLPVFAATPFEQPRLIEPPAQHPPPFSVNQQPLFLTPEMTQPESGDHGVLPGGLLYKSYIAGPHEPRFASVLLYDVSAGEWRWDSTLGGRLGLYRQGYSTFSDFDEWQIDVEGAVMSRLDPEKQMDVESNDFRFGLLWTGRRDNLAVKFGYFHMSSHVGDEFLINNPTFTRINFVRESIILGSSLQATPQTRLYGEVAWAFAARGGALPLQFQFGTEFSAIAPFPEHGAPFTALNVQMREETDFAAGLTVMTGWQWTGLKSKRTMRVGMQYFNGPSNQYSFFRRYDNQFGLGLWIDF